jgi:RNA polymerase sigma-70 factor (ECF subfamily)
MELKEFKLRILPLRDKLCGFAAKILGSADDAEDATQDVMMKLWNKRHELDACNSVEAFAMTMVRNTCIDMQRKDKGDTLSIDDLQIASTGSEQQFEMHEEAELVKQIIEHLPELQRNTIRMKDIEGYENDEIAEIIGCSSESVRSNLSRARKQVRTVYLQIVRERKRVC